MVISWRKVPKVSRAIIQVILTKYVLADARIKLKRIKIQMPAVAAVAVAVEAAVAAVVAAAVAAVAT